jgi:hypothetical protein
MDVAGTGGEPELTIKRVFIRQWIRTVQLDIFPQHLVSFWLFETFAGCLLTYGGRVGVQWEIVIGIGGFRIVLYALENVATDFFHVGNIKPCTILIASTRMRMVSNNRVVPLSTLRSGMRVRGSGTIGKGCLYRLFGGIQDIARANYILCKHKHKYAAVQEPQKEALARPGCCHVVDPLAVCRQVRKVVMESKMTQMTVQFSTEDNSQAGESDRRSEILSNHQG